MHRQHYFIPGEELLDPQALAALQRIKLGHLLRRVREGNRFYRHKLEGITFDPLRDPLERLPLTTRKELEQDQADNPIYGTNLTEPMSAYCRYHQTSGTGGRPMRWLDTPESWEWIKKCWGVIFTAAGIGQADRLCFPFSFGPFLGFWAAFESSVSLGMLTLPAGGLSTTARLRMILDNGVTAIGCTPTYALRMVQVAMEEGLDLKNSSVRALIVAGEPGGSIPEVRAQIEKGWGARVFDHTGMTEIGPLGFECAEAPGGVHLIESECIPEVIDPMTLLPVPDGTPGELVITNLGRMGSPVIRYRTGDQVVLRRGRCACGRCFARMEGGIRGRMDDMLIVRGNNVFPSAVEAVIRRFPEVAEFRVEAYDSGNLTQVRIDIEPKADAGDPRELSARVAHTIADTLNLRTEVRAVAEGSLPRFEMKAQRFVRKRS